MQKLHHVTNQANKVHSQALKVLEKKINRIWRWEIQKPKLTVLQTKILSTKSEESMQCISASRSWLENLETPSA